MNPPSPPSNATAASNITIPPILPIDPPDNTTARSSSTMSNIRAENTTNIGSTNTADSSSNTTDNSSNTTIATTNTTGTQPSPQPPRLPSSAANTTTSMQPQPSSIFPSSILPSSMPSPRRPFTPLQGSRCFRLRLTPPPVDSFWSVTVYNASNLNLLEGVTKFGVGDRTPGLLVRLSCLRLTPPLVDSFWSVTIYNASNLNLLEGVTMFGVGYRTPGLLVSLSCLRLTLFWSTPSGLSPSTMLLISTFWRESASLASVTVHPAYW
ncbi:unnamed protein product [Closterium sp. Yama58-4]|nr:unnamed protein product [Closterium sp. Yama58-4]